MLPVVKNFNGPLELSKIVWMRRENEVPFLPNEQSDLVTENSTVQSTLCNISTLSFIIECLIGRSITAYTSHNKTPFSGMI